MILGNSVCCALLVRCRAYSGSESGKSENKSEEHELGDDDDVVDDNSKLKFVRTRLLCYCYIIQPHQLSPYTLAP